MLKIFLGVEKCWLTSIWERADSGHGMGHQLTIALFDLPSVRLFRHVLEKSDVGFDAAIVIGEMKLFIRRMKIVVWQAKAEHD